MREVITTVIVRCNFCNAEHSDLHPVVSRTFVWEGQEREMDLCPVDLKETDAMFASLVANSQPVERPTRARTTRSTRKAPYSGDTRFNQWYNGRSRMFECPAVEGEHRCTRQFTTANGLAVHHQKKHGTHL